MYLVLDIETTMYGGYERGSNPFYKDRILCIGLKYQMRGALTPHRDGRSKSIRDTLFALKELQKGWLQNVTVLVGHNIKFDLLFLWENEELQDFFKRGGKIWDTQLSEYILTGQQHKYPALRDIAVNKYGCQERIKNIEVNKKKGVLTHNMDINLLLLDVKNDVLDTEQVMIKQIRLAKERGMFKLIMEQMEGLLATTEMEFNGMYCNEEILEMNKREIESELMTTEAECQQLIGDYWYE